MLELALKLLSCVFELVKFVLPFVLDGVGGL